MKKKLINLFMLSTIIMSQMTLGLTALAIEIDTNESSEDMTENLADYTTEDTSSTEEKSEEGISKSKNKDATEQSTKKQLVEVDTTEATNFIGPLVAEESPRSTDLDITSPNIWLPLGSPRQRSEDIVKENATVKKDGKTLSTDEYVIMSLLVADNTQTITSRNDDHQLIMTASTSNFDGSSGSSIINYGVDYGNSIVFGTNTKNAVAGAFTIHNTTASGGRSIATITARNGQGSTNSAVNSDYSGQDYYKFELFEKETGMNSVVITDDSVPDKVISAKGDDIKSSVLNDWSDQTVNIGSIIRTWSAESGANLLYKGNKSDSPTVNNYADKDGYAYYEVTTNGYLPITSTFLDVKERDISMSTTDQQLDDSIADSFVNVPDSVTIEGFTEYPSRENAGKTTGKIKVSEILPSNGQRLERIYEVPFNVTEAPQANLEVVFKEVDIPLGTPTSSMDAYDFIEAVYNDGEKLNKNDYIAEFIDPPYAMYIGTDDRVEVKVTLKEDENISVTELTTAKIRYGNTLISKAGTNANSLVMTSISLFEDNNKPKLIMNYGIGYNNRYESGNELNIYRDNEKNTLFSKKENLSSSYQNATINEWQPALDKISLQYGDVLKQSPKDVKGNSFKGEATYVSRNEELVKETAGFNDAYYELTKDGYHLLKLNQMTVNTEAPSFNVGTSHTDMNNVAKDQMTLPVGAKASDYRFEYEGVDTATPGKKTTKMNVYEKLTTGGEFMTTYDVSYEVVEEVIIETLEVELQEVSTPVGTKTELLDPNDYIKEVRLGNKKLSSSEYTASFDKKPNTNSVSAKTSGDIKKEETKIKIEVKDTKQSITGTTATKITWNNTITTKSSSGSYTSTAISLLDNNNKPYLVANQGVNFSTSNLTFNPVISAYRNDLNTPLIADGTNAGTNKQPVETMNKWNTMFNTLDLQYGDVFGYTISESNGKNSLGKRTWATRNEELVLETEGYEDAYYELTKDGYRLMRFNQMTVSDTVPSFGVGATKAEMNQVADNQMILPAGAESKNYRFEYDSVDTAKAGTKTTKMNVYEKLSNGQEFKTTYDVSYKVTESLRVELQPVSIPVGTDKSAIDTADYVKGVYSGSTKIDKKDYTVSIESDLNTSLVGSQSTKVIVTLKTGDKETITETTNTNILWGNSLATTTKTNATLYESSVSMLDVSGQPLLRANEGTGLSTNNSLTTEPNVSIYRGSDTSKLYEAKTNTKSQTPKKLMETWQTEFNKYSLAYGDVLSYSVQSEKGNTTVAARSEKVVKETVGFDSAYYELTKDGYRLMRANQFTVKSDVPNVAINTSHADMNEKAADQLNLPIEATANDYRIEYASVDTKTAGKKTTKMNVYEKLASGGEFMTTYDVSYEVAEEVIVETLEVDLQEVSIPVGTKTESLNPNEYVKEVRLDGKKIAESEYTASFVSAPTTNLVSTNPNGVVNKEKTQIKIETKDKKQTVTKETATMILWGNNIGALRKPGSDSFDSSVSMIDVNGKPILRANEGNGLSTHSSLNTEPNLSVYRNNDTTKLYEAKTKTKSQKASKLMTTWQSEFDKYNLVYGDVVSYTVPGQKGANTVISKSEKLVTETEGFDSVYYELTKDGYRLMRANQFTVKSDTLNFDINTTHTDMNKKAADQLNLPTGATASDYRIEYASVDTKTVGKKTTKMNVYEKLAVGGEFMTTYDVEYNVTQGDIMSVQLKEQNVFVGVDSSTLIAKNYLSKVYFGDREQYNTYFEAEFVELPNTNLVGTQKAKIKVYEKSNPSNFVIEESTSNILWGSSVVTMSTKDSNKTDTSISLLNIDNKPKLVANEGAGFATGNLSLRPEFKVYRGTDTDTPITNGKYDSVNKPAKNTMDKFNNALSQKELQYGDVLDYTVFSFSSTSRNELGASTLVSRDEKLVKETEGYSNAYYELTTNGYNLLKGNQMTVNSDVPSFNADTTIEEMNKTAKDRLTLSADSDSNNFRIEYASVDTTTSGEKTTKMNVYEKLASGGEFMTTYDVKYNVNENPKLTEKSVDETGKELKTETKEIPKGQSYQPTPDNYLTINGVTYTYQGWLTSSQTAGKDQPTAGNPPAVNSATTYQYVYSNTDSMINVTMPTEMLFGTYKSGSSTISSGKSVVKNNSKDIKTEVIMSEFKKEKSSVKLLKSGQSHNLVLKEKTARLNLTADNKEVIGSLNESDKDKTIKELAPETETTLGMTGKYYGELSKPQKVQYKMILKFKAKQ